MMRWVEHIAPHRELRNAYGIYIQLLKVRDQLGGVFLMTHSPCCMPFALKRFANVHHFVIYAFPRLFYTLWLAVLCYANPYLFHYFLWEYHFLFMPAFSGTQLGHKTRAWYNVKMDSKAVE